MCNEKGYTFIWMMFTVALAGILLGGAGQMWKTEARRDKEKELLFVGEQFRLAIGSYYESSPGAKRYPDSLEKLLFDDRFPTATRHLRKIFYDPMTGLAEWGLIKRPGVGVVGVHSLSTEKPLKRAKFHERYASFSRADSYRDWKFVYLPGEASAGGSQAPSQTQAQPQPDSPSNQKSDQTQNDSRQQKESGSSPFSALPGASDSDDPIFRRPEPPR